MSTSISRSLVSLLLMSLLVLKSYKQWNGPGSSLEDAASLEFYDLILRTILSPSFSEASTTFRDRYKIKADLRPDVANLELTVSEESDHAAVENVMSWRASVKDNPILSFLNENRQVAQRARW